MKKIIFGGKDAFGRETKNNYPTNDKYVLLSYFIDDIEYDINEKIIELEQVVKGEKTFDEILEDDIGWSIADGFGGVFICNQTTAYFTAEENSNLPSMQMPLKELIEILYEWKEFLGK